MAVARHHLALGHHALVIKRVQEALQVEPALESAHRLLMQCLAETGQLEQALSQYHLCEAQLAFHQDRAPSARTNTLYQQLVDSTGSAGVSVPRGL
jgi:DNA-binding SARP family transcriptional activator